MTIKLEKFSREHYSDLISWIDSEEMLMQFGGPLLTYPLTAEQLDPSLADPNRIAFRISAVATNAPIGHAEIYTSEISAKLGRIVIGNMEMRGKGLCRQIMQLLLDYTFFKLDKQVIELNVFDFNTGAIKCYEKLGFVINPDKKLLRQVKGQTWTAINMTINKPAYQDLMSAKA